MRLDLLRKELGSYTMSERLFILFAMLVNFLICAEYAIVRPVSNSLFIQAFGAELFPYAWLATVPLNILIVSLYNSLLPRLGCFKLFFVSIVVVAGGNLFFACFFERFASLPFIFYVWKELYVLLMFQQLWSVIHSTVQIDRAKYLYGFFFGIGGLGSLFGSAFPGFFAVTYGSEKLLFLSCPLYLFLLLFYWRMTRHAAVHHVTTEFKRHSVASLQSFLHGCQLIARSRFLIFALLIVVLMQFSSALIDFQFNAFLGKTIADKDLRTEYGARVLGIVHALTVSMQFIGSYFLIRLVGLKRSYYALPLLIGGGVLSYALFPLFPLLGLSYIAVKSLDFSLFGILREMLYVPLKSDEKFRAKAVIDIFAYRSAKALASFLILALQVFFIDVSPILTYTTLGLSGLWIAVTAWNFKRAVA